MKKQLALIPALLFGLTAQASADGTLPFTTARTSDAASCYDPRPVDAPGLKRTCSGTGIVYIGLPIAIWDGPGTTHYNISVWARRATSSQTVLCWTESHSGLNVIQEAAQSLTANSTNPQVLHFIQEVEVDGVVDVVCSIGVGAHLLSIEYSEF